MTQDHQTVPIVRHSEPDRGSGGLKTCKFLKFWKFSLILN